MCSQPSHSTANYYIELIQNTLESYRLGYVKRIQITQNDFGKLFYDDWQTFIETRLPLTDQWLLNRLDKIRIRGLNAARQGDLITAEQYFTSARVRLQLDKLSPQGSLLYKSSLERAQAYVDYRRGDFDQARNRTSEALAAYVFLEEEYGYEILFLRRLQLVCNLVRLEARCLCYERVIELACQILSYLEGTSEVLPIPGSWGRERVACQSPELVAATFALVTGEVAEILAGKDRQLVSDLFAVASGHLHLQASNNRHCHPGAYSWLLVKQAFVNNDVPKFLELASHFLAEGRADIPLLWYATVIDLVRLCNELNLPNIELVKQEIAREAVTWEYCPQKFFALLGVCPKNERTQEPEVLKNPKPHKALLI